MIRKILFVLLILSLIQTDKIFAQCNQSVKWVIERIETITESGEVRKVSDVGMTIITNENKILITENSTGQLLTGNISEKSCDWSKPFASGKSFYKAIFRKADESQSSGEMLVEGGGEKVQIVISFSNTPGKARMILNRFEIL